MAAGSSSDVGIDLVPKKNGFSAIWSHFGFKPDSEYETTPVCRLCGKVVAAKSGEA